MRDTVVIDGVTITRKQFEEVMAKFNEPEPFQAGDVIVSPEEPFYTPSVVLMGGKKRVSAHGETKDYGDESYSPDWKRIGTLTEVVAFYRQHHPEAKS